MDIRIYFFHEDIDMKDIEIVEYNWSLSRDCRGAQSQEQMDSDALLSTLMYVLTCQALVIVG
jgi:hypothetical protein